MREIHIFMKKVKSTVVEIPEIGVPETNAAVATQQRSANEGFSLLSPIDYSSLPNDALHRVVQVARNGFAQRSLEWHGALVELIPACEEIIKRFKLPGVPPKDRPNGQPTVQAYFASIGLNYSTVRSWFFRGRIKSEFFLLPKMSPFAAKTLKLVEAAKTGENLEQATSEVEEVFPIAFPEGHIEPPSDDAIPRLTMRLVVLLDKYFVDPNIQLSDPQKPSMPKEVRDIVDRLHAELPAALFVKKRRKAQREVQQKAG
jgi:hypothetical protein